MPHGRSPGEGAHVIAPGDVWKKKCPTFKKVVKKLAEYFKMDVEDDRLNFYRDSEDWKPYHHDAAAKYVSI